MPISFFTKQKKMKLLIASNNNHKIEEIKAALCNIFEDITSLKEESIACDPEETGSDFYENALIKAKAVQKMTNLPILADDTGLCVNALGGLPGIHSARYASDHNSAVNREKILRELKGITNREAYFQCVVVLLYPNGTILSGTGRVDGYITEVEMGQGGFGYDCIFYSDEPLSPKSCLSVTEAEHCRILLIKYTISTFEFL